MPEATPGATATTEEADASGSGRRQNKFLADLTKAMQAAAESAREETMGRLQAEAKTSVEQIHERSANEAAALRRQADDDVAAIREWSKAEVARIREETDQRIAERKSRLEQELEEHAGQIERRIERVQSRVGTFEAEMAGFFERLLAEQDPTRFAAMAENLPEPPPFDGDDLPPPAEAASTAPAGSRVVFEDAPVSRIRQAGQDAESAMAAIQAAAEAAAGDETFVQPGAGQPVDGATGADVDPRLSILAQTSDLAAAEAEAMAAAGRSDPAEEIPTIADDALAARLAGLVPGTSEPATAIGEQTSTQVVVTGLVSVASIASFKRHLGRVAGVQSVGVSSGPEGEFVFAVHHGPEVALRDAIPSLPGFRARVTGGSGSTVEVAAHDPESQG